MTRDFPPWFGCVKYQYNTDLLEWCRNMPGAAGSFDKPTKTWLIPIEMLNTFRELAVTKNVRVEGWYSDGRKF